MDLYQATLRTGISISAHAHYRTLTFGGGLAIGRHSPERIRRKLRIVTDTVRPIVPSAPFHALLDNELLERREWCLPYFTSVTWFVSEHLSGDKYHGSHLAVIHFQDTNDSHFDDANLELLKAIDWPSLATGFQY
ncbi:MAG: hypothetical protein R3C18_09770 [Planctomycetaceae bacterium]